MLSLNLLSFLPPQVRSAEDPEPSPLGEDALTTFLTTRAKPLGTLGNASG
jgi:hypothetical protein